MSVRGMVVDIGFFAAPRSGAAGWRLRGLWLRSDAHERGTQRHRETPYSGRARRCMSGHCEANGVRKMMPGSGRTNESDQQKPVKHRLAWRSSWFSDNVAPRKIIEEIKILGVLANEHTGFFS